MFWKKNTPLELVAPAMSEESKVYVEWKSGGRQQGIGLPEGKHTIGSSPVATIQVGSGSPSICGVILASQDKLTLKCVHVRPTMFVDGKKMSPGDSVLVGDSVELIVGRTPVSVSAAAVAQTPDHMKSEGESRDSGLMSLENTGSVEDVDSLRRNLAKELLDQLNLKDLELKTLDSPRVRQAARLRLKKILAKVPADKRFGLSEADLEDQIFHEVMGLGPLEPLLADAKVTEIMVNRRDQIFIEKSGKLSLSKVNFSSDQALLNVIERIVSRVGRRIDTSSPIVDARLLDGSRVNAVIPPLALKGPCLTIRRFSKKPITVNQLVKWGSIAPEMANFLRHCVENHKNIIISGGTGSGKTTLLNSLSSFIPSNERIVTVEDAAELQLQQPHIISLETRPPNLEGVGGIAIRDLVKNTLRMRPDRIIVGECRGAEALDMLQAMNTGHDGSMTTAHANSPEDMLRRLETMVLMAGMELPLSAIREQISSALTLVVQQVRRKTGERLVTQVAWIRPLNRATGEYDCVALFQRDKSSKLTCNMPLIREFWRKEELEGDLEEVLWPEEKAATPVKSKRSKSTKK